MRDLSPTDRSQSHTDLAVPQPKHKQEGEGQYDKGEDQVIGHRYRSEDVKIMLAAAPRVEFS